MIERRLAAILVADIAGYSRLVGMDEIGILSEVDSINTEILEPLAAKHRGRLVKYMGDGALIEFGSAVNAVEYAVAFQSAVAQANTVRAGAPIVYRVGIALADVVLRGSDVFGDGVNIAARLESIAEPGSIFVSDSVFAQVRGKCGHDFADLGLKTLKNIDRQVGVYRVMAPSVLTNSAAAPVGAQAPVSLIVLPFANDSGDREQEYFSDGISEDIITDLSKVSALQVVSRTTSFMLKGRPLAIEKTRSDLRVSHIVTGNVRKSGSRVRVSAQLVDSARDTEIWAERYDREISDVFALQDELSTAIVTALKVRLLPDERTAIETRSTYDSDAYRYYLMGRSYFSLRGARNYEIALRFCRRALEIDTNYARAWALSSLCMSYLHTAGRSADTGMEEARRALLIEPDLSEAHAAIGRVLAERGQFDDALEEHRQSADLEPDSFDVHHNFGMTYLELGEYEQAIEHFHYAASLHATDHTALNLLALAQRGLGQEDEFRKTTHEALERIEREIAMRRDNANAIAHGALALARLGEKERAVEWIERALIIEPDDMTDRYNLSCALAQILEIDRAIDLLESCVFRMPVEFAQWLKQDADLQPLAGHPRFVGIVEKCERRIAASGPPGA
ncbi:TPR end-of-group domain-containing protein [Mesorhizobium sp. 10J20-29]